MVTRNRVTRRRSLMLAAHHARLAADAVRSLASGLQVWAVEAWREPSDSCERKVPVAPRHLASHDGGTTLKFTADFFYLLFERTR